jgi:hypothetical protein
MPIEIWAISLRDYVTYVDGIVNNDWV